MRPDSVDEAQYRALKAFRDSKRQQGLVEEYDSPDQFREKFRRQLTQTIMSNFRSQIPSDISSAMAEPVESDIPHALWDPEADEHRLVASLSGDARALLQAAGRDQHGTVLKVETFGGLSVQADEREFVQPGDVRSETRWRGALAELISQGLLEQRDREGAVFSITNQGFKIVDVMQRT